MTAVTIRPTFSKDTRPSNGLEEIADELIADKVKVHYVVGIVKWAGGSVDIDGAITPAVKFLGLEPLEGAAAEAAKALLDKARDVRGLGSVKELEQPQPDPTLFDFEGPGDGPVRVGEVRLGADGEHTVPPPSGEELLAEAEEARAAGVPSATFSGGDE